MRLEQVVIKSLVKSYDGATVVKGIDLSINKGEFFFLLGPSGCGKTTTLRMIGGFEQPTSGSVYISGELVNGKPPYKRRVNTVFQNYALFPHMNVFENLAFGLVQKKTTKKIIKEKVVQMLDLVNLSGFEKRRINEMSGGQQQRIALARALINEPEVLLLDEPLGALDQKMRKKMQVELKRLQEQLDLTFIMVTHDQEEALAMSDRIAVMNKGRIEQVGRPYEIYEFPKSRFVADFIGATNLLKVRVLEVDSRFIMLKFADKTLKAMKNGVPCSSGDDLEVSVRPERFWLAKESDESAVNTLHGAITDVMFLGDVTLFEVKLKSGALVHVAQQNRTYSENGKTPNEGDEIYLHCNPDALRLVPP